MGKGRDLFGRIEVLPNWSRSALGGGNEGGGGQGDRGILEGS